MAKNLIYRLRGQIKEIPILSVKIRVHPWLTTLFAHLLPVYA